jgi:hypothetical protein
MPDALPQRGLGLSPACPVNSLVTSTILTSTPPAAAAAKTALSPTTLRRRLILAEVAGLIAGIALGFIAQRLFGTASRPQTTTVTPTPGQEPLDRLGLVSAPLPVFVLAAGSNRPYQTRANIRRPKRR